MGVRRTIRESGTPVRLMLVVYVLLIIYVNLISRFGTRVVYVGPIETPVEASRGVGR